MKTIKYFTAAWCGPCKMFKPVMTELQSEGLNIQFVDVDNNPLEAQNYGIRSVPTCVLLDNGREVTRWTGPLPKLEIKKRYGAL